MSDFKGSTPIYLQPSEDNISYSFAVEVKESTTSASGWLAFGTTISGVVVTAYKESDIDNKSLEGGQITATDIIQGVPTVNDNNITVRTSYPSTNGEGHYKLTFVLTVDDGSTQELDFDPIICKER